MQAHSDGGELLAFVPGQYIGVRLILNGEEVRRNYSLSAAHNGRQYRISVKREPNGRVSNHLHANVNVGHTIELFAPSGEFRLEHTDKPLVLISGGVGITPTLAMLETALETKRPIHFIHAARHCGVHAFRGLTDELAAWLPATRDVDVYFLGPLPFMEAVKKQLKAIGVPEAQSHYEFFGPAAALE